MLYVYIILYGLYYIPIMSFVKSKIKFTFAYTYIKYEY